MDQNVLVEGDAVGLMRIADAFRAKGLTVSGIYLIGLSTETDDMEWIIRLVQDDKVPGAARRMIYDLVKLRREGALPDIDPAVRFDVVAADHPEALRICDYARQFESLPVLIRNVMWKGLFVEYALVAEVPQSALAVA